MDVSMGLCLILKWYYSEFEFCFDVDFRFHLPILLRNLMN
jgi:hypothetical protein